MGNQQSTVGNKPRVNFHEPERAGESKVITSAYVTDREKLFTFVEPFTEVTTLHEALLNTTKNFPDRPFLGTKNNNTNTYDWLSYSAVEKRARAIGSGLVELGLVPHKDKVGISSINRLEWNLTEYACNGFSLCLVPLYETLGKEGVLHILHECQLSIVVCSTEKLKVLLSYASEVSYLKIIVTFTAPDEELKKTAQEKFNINVITFAELEELGNSKLKDYDPPKSDEYATICYTSGTTGLPKGVILNHLNFISSANGLVYGEVKVSETDVHLSYLPSAHVFERVMATILLMAGGAMGYYSGDARKLFDDMLVLKPTVFVTVPRLLGRLYDKVIEAVTVGGITQFAFEQAYEAKLANLRKGDVTHPIYDSLIFSKIKDKLGGNVRFIITGSAPIAPNLMDFLRVCFCCPVLEGYGQTETTCGGTRTLLWDTDTGHVGVPTPVIQIKLVDVPELNYLSSNNPPSGEICFKGPTCTTGYFNNPEKTKELLDEHGWLHSGDVGCMFPNGNIKIIDRVKNLFKLSIGEYIAPEKVEQVFTQSKWVAQAFIHGDSLKASLVAILVPDQEVLNKWAEEVNHEHKGDLAALCADEKINKMILDDLAVLGKKCDLKSFEMPKKVFLSSVPFTVENDQLTPTFKLKRPQAKAAYKDILDKLYEGIE